MGKGHDAVEDFIDSIPDEKLSAFADMEGKIFSDINFRLDDQGLTSGEPRFHNLQIQINNQTKISTLKREKGQTVAHTLVPTDGFMSPEEIREALVDSIMI